MEELLNRPTTRTLRRSEDIIKIHYVSNNLRNRRLGDVASLLWEYVPLTEESNMITANDCVEIPTANCIIYAEEVRPGTFVGLDRKEEMGFSQSGRTVLLNTNALNAPPEVITNHERCPHLLCFAGDMLYYQYDDEDRHIYRVPIDRPESYEPEKIELEMFLVPRGIIDIGGVLVVWQPILTCVHGLRLDTKEWWQIANVACPIENLDGRFVGEHWPEGKPKLELLFTPSDGLLNKVVLWRESDDKDHPHGIMMERKLKHLSPEVVKFCPRSKNKAIIALVSQDGNRHTCHRFGPGIGILDFETGCFISHFDYNYRTCNITAMSVITRGDEVKAIMLFPARGGSGPVYAMTFTITAEEGSCCKNCGRSYKKECFMDRHEAQCSPVPMKERKFHFRYGSVQSDASSRSSESDDSDVHRDECIVM